MNFVSVILPHRAMLPRPSANHRSDLVAFCRLPELVTPQSSILLLVSAAFKKHFSEHIVPKTTFSVSQPLWLEWRQIRQRPLQRSNPCWYLMLSPCLNSNCHWYPKCNLEAFNFHWECVVMVFIVLLEIFSYLFEDMPHKGLYQDEYLQIFWCLNIHISHFLNLQWSNRYLLSDFNLVCQPETNTFLGNYGSLFESVK